MLEWIQTYLPNVYNIGWTGDNGWLAAINATLYMTIISFIIGGFLGLLAGLFLVLTGPGGVIENRPVFQVLDKVTSVFRAIPFIILLAILAPVTFFIVKTNLGATAALVPLSAATFPFFARQVQVVLSELDRGVIEAAQASGATLFDIIKVYLSEGLPDLIRVSTVTLISLVGETAMAGAIGAGGLGNVAISYGYNRSNTDVTFVATLAILLLIFAIQFIGDVLTRKLSHR
ncbi:methionine ABC transporter permease [Streptococcus agalactiae LMG 14747]|uniref:Methionine ABC transporter permease n=2 Tax=Streptococcus TaxID=1301 RepID=V6Z417_STRAG|nr:methionine ABC transporter permease [Streptococcus acidominimus]ESV55670.1 methionine ABC transporter permease [Streptococcus agalactiae LMG 14747]SNV35418.1 D-methionine transport system permease protein [Streptococcus acidominimus]